VMLSRPFDPVAPLLEWLNMTASFARRDSVQLPPSTLLKNNRLLTDGLTSSD